MLGCSSRGRERGVLRPIVVIIVLVNIVIIVIIIVKCVASPLIDIDITIISQQ